MERWCHRGVLCTLPADRVGGPLGHWTTAAPVPLPLWHAHHGRCGTHHIHMSSMVCLLPCGGTLASDPARGAVSCSQGTAPALGAFRAGRRRLDP